VNGLDVGPGDDEASELARSFTSDCLRVLRRLCENAPDAESREHAAGALAHALVQLKWLELAPNVSDDARAQAAEALKAFLNS
jgi:hypothetical protein